MYELMVYLLIVSLSATALVKSDENSDIIWRTDLGVVFHPVARINNANSAWLHVYQIPRLKQLPVPRVPDICQPLAYIFHYWNDLQDVVTPPPFPNDRNKRDGRYPPLYIEEPEMLRTYSGNYLFEQCKKHQEVIVDIWKQITSINEGTKINLNAIATLMEDAELYLELPSHPNDTSNRLKRNPLSFISTGAKHLFGFATQKDLKKFAELFNPYVLSADAN